MVFGERRRGRISGGALTARSRRWRTSKRTIWSDVYPRCTWRVRGYRACGRAVKYWVGVASADHVQTAVAGGFVQLGHGKSAPVRRLLPSDLMAFYSPRSQLHAGVPVQSFTAIGRVCDREPYLYPQTPSFSPTRRDVTYFKAQAAPIEPLLGELSFIHPGKSWGLPFRRGLIEVSEQDMRAIANAMKACSPR